MRRRNSNTTESASSPRRFVVYGLVDPRDGQVRYIGRSQNPERRLVGHLGSLDSRFTGGSKKKRAWLRDLLAAGLRPTIRALEAFADELVAVQAEGEWIKKGFAEGWPLTNSHKSGRGILCTETKRKIARADKLRRRRWLRKNEEVVYEITLRGKDVRALRLAALLLNISEEDAFDRLQHRPGGEAFDRALSDLIKRRHELLREKPQAASTSPGAA